MNWGLCLVFRPRSSASSRSCLVLPLGVTATPTLPPAFFGIEFTWLLSMLGLQLAVALIVVVVVVVASPPLSSPAVPFVLISTCVVVVIVFYVD